MRGAANGEVKPCLKVTSDHLRELDGGLRLSRYTFVSGFRAEALVGSVFVFNETKPAIEIDRGARAGDDQSQLVKPFVSQ